jgi:7,8-dihydroneopterin aldolase/epimerase/oxygenase
MPSDEDTVFVAGLEVPCKVGVAPGERAVPQTVIVDIRVWSDFARASVTDSVSDTVSYSKLIQRTKTVASARKYRLLESMAEELARMALSFQGSRGVKVRLRKGKYRGEPSAGIEIMRWKHA